MAATEQLTWYAARAGGLVAYVLVTAAVVGGLLLAGRRRLWVPPRDWLLDLHRFLGGLACVFTAGHLVAVVLDDHEHFGLAELLVPLTATYRPVAVAWGVVALYLLVAVEVTSLVRRRLPHRLWRNIHLTSVPLFVLASVHTLTAGTDGGHPLVQGLVAIACALVGGLGVARLAALRPSFGHRGTVSAGRVRTSGGDRQRRALR